jgi:transcriptional regulator with XRE-family HTH domain
MNRDFVERLDKTFDRATMAEVARRLGIPHATVRNYYKEGRLPAPEVLIKIAGETGVSLNWLLTGAGDMYAGQSPPVGLGKFIEKKIGEMIDERLAAADSRPVIEIHNAEVRHAFDVRSAIDEFDDPERVIGEWFRHEGRDVPQDLGLAFFRGWESFSTKEKEVAIRDAKKLLDRVVKNEE